MTKFQIILLSVFGFFILFAVLIFALYKGTGSNQEARVTIWGSFPREVFERVISDTASLIDPSLTLSYTEKSSQTIDAELTEALARGEGPDLIIFSQDKVWKNRLKLVPIPYESVTEGNFKEAFVEEGELLLLPDGVYGLPVAIDPMILYYNRDLLSLAGEAQPISYWDEIYALTPKLTKRDAAGNLVESVIALGETRNIPRYKDILSLLFLQAGTPITAFGGEDLRSFLTEKFNQPVTPAQSALDFYTQFSNPSKAYYSWNRTLPEAQTHFASGDSAYYLGFASELPEIRSKNPNLNFQVTTVPQSRVAGRAVTFGKLYSASITRGSRNPSAALRAGLLLASKDVSGTLAQALGLSPARRDLLAERKTDAVSPVLYQSALQARGWLDPDDVATQAIFGEMIELITSGRANTSEVLTDANRKMEDLLE